MFISPGGRQSRKRTVPSGANTQVQFNDSSSTGGDANLTWNKANTLLSVGSGGVNTAINSTALNAGGTVTGGQGVIIGANYPLQFGPYSKINSQTDGNVTLLNAATTGFNLLQFGGSNTSYPAIKRNATALNIRLADDSADAALTASLVTANHAGNGASLTSIISAQNLVATGTATTAIPLSVVGAASATANLFQVSNSGSVQFAINSLGCGVFGTAGSLAISTVNATTVGILATNNTITIGNSTVNSIINSTAFMTDTNYNLHVYPPKSFVVLGPVAADVYPIFWTNTAITVAEIVTVVTNTAASPGINTAFYSGTTLGTVVGTILGTTNTSNITTGLHTTSFTTAAVAANSWVWCNVNTVSSINTFAVTMRFS